MQCVIVRRPNRLLKKSAGFTLLELMVVLVLIGIIFSYAILSIGGDDVAELMEVETRRLVTLLDMAGEEAILRGEELGLHFGDTGYSFLVLQQDGWSELGNDRLLKPRELPADIELRLELEGELPVLGESDEDEDADNSLVPQVYILSSGEMTPFTVTLRSSRSDVLYILTASILGKLDWEAGQDL